MGSWAVRLTWLDCNQRSYIWSFGWTLRVYVRLACAQTPKLFFDLHVPFNSQRKNNKIIYANVYRNTINDGDSQTSPLPTFPEGGGGGTSVHRLASLSKSPSSDCGAGKRRPLATSSLAALAKKFMRSTCGKSTRWEVSSFRETKLHLFVYTFPLLFPFRLVVGESDDVKRFLIMSWSDSHSPL